MPPPLGVLRGGFIHDLLEHLAEVVKVVEADHEGDFGDGSAASLQVEGGFSQDTVIIFVNPRTGNPISFRACWISSTNKLQTIIIFML